MLSDGTLELLKARVLQGRERALESAAQADRAGGARMRRFVVGLVALLAIFLASKKVTLALAYAPVYQWYKGEKAWANSGFAADKPDAMPVGIMECFYAKDYYPMYRTFGLFFGWKGRISRRQAQFVVRALMDLVYRPGFAGIHLCGSPEQLSAARAKEFLGIDPDISDTQARATRWAQKDNPFRMLYASAEDLVSNFAWNEAYAMAKNNGGNFESSYMWSLFQGGLLRVAVEHVARDSTTPVEMYLHQLYGGHAYLAAKNCKAKKWDNIVNYASSGAALGSMFGGGAGSALSKGKARRGGKLSKGSLSGLSGLAAAGGIAAGAFLGSRASTAC